MSVQHFNRDPTLLVLRLLNNVRSGTDVVRATSAYDSPLRTLLRALDDDLLLVLPATHHHLLYSSLFVFKGIY